MPIRVPLRMVTSLQQSFPFIWHRDCIPYLGTYITPNLRRLYNLNYGSLLREIVKDLQRWRGHLLTWFGRVNALKTSIFTIIIYILHMVPVAHPQIFFLNQYGELSQLVWGDKTAQVSA